MWYGSRRHGGSEAHARHDSRDDDNSPSRGRILNANLIAYREWLGGSQNFDVYRSDLKTFRSRGAGNAFAVRQNNEWTVAAAFAPVKLQGYQIGQYLGKYMSSIEAPLLITKVP